MAKSKEELEQEAGEAEEKKAESRASKAGKLVLFNHSKNPYELGKNEDGTRRMFLVGSSIECKDQAEYDMLRNYRGVGTTAQVAPNLQAHVDSLQEKINTQASENAELKKQLEKFQAKGK